MPSSCSISWFVWSPRHSKIRYIIDVVMFGRLIRPYSTHVFATPCGRFGRVHKVQLCAALLQHTEQVTWRWHNRPPHRLLANWLNLPATPQLVPTSKSFFLSVIRCSAACKSRNLAKNRFPRTYAGCFFFQRNSMWRTFRVNTCND